MRSRSCTAQRRRRADARERYLTLLRSGGSDHPMALLQQAGVDLSQPETVRAVVEQLDALVTQLEQELGNRAGLGSLSGRRTGGGLSP